MSSENLATRRPAELSDVLAARDARAETQARLLKAYHRPLLGLTMNIAGPVKRSGLIDFAFRETLRELKRRLGDAVLCEELSGGAAGLEAVLVCDRDADALKTLAVELETERPAGRLCDLDVIGADGVKLSRTVPRACLVCGGPASPCARSRAHGLEAITNAANALLRDFAAEKLSELAVKALMDEVDLTPKPGLVDRNNGGAHRDMDWETFHRSALSLQPYFCRAVILGMENTDCMPELQSAGLDAESTMLSATGGVNTHKGAIYAFGLALAALGGCLCRGGDVFQIAAALASAGRPPGNDTHGSQIQKRYGAAGARGEALAGFPHARRACGLLAEKGPFYALLVLLAETVDTNLLYRGGMDGLRFVQEQARAILNGSESGYRAGLLDFDRACIEKNLSPGGCADLLALGMLLDRTREIWEMESAEIKFCPLDKTENDRYNKKTEGALRQAASPI